MVNCVDCGKKFKTAQALSGHKRFKHDKDFIKPKTNGNINHERILINGRTVVKVSELGLCISTLSRIMELIESIEDFKPVECPDCYKILWQHEDVIACKTRVIYRCPWCGCGPTITFS